ncbi:MAG: hypothetical protein L3J96_07010, partial [Thermoplasmata archaeon]|nr:hypothetical protein [Thermoplasmata archaeon]
MSVLQPRGRRPHARWTLLAVVVTLVLTALPIGVLSGSPVGSRAPSPVIGASGQSAGASFPPTVAANTYFQSQTIPNAPNASCASGACYAASAEPSINYTSRGIVAVAYTAMTNQSPCANSTPYAQSEIGFTRATAPGTVWSTPIYLGNTNCTEAREYPSAW